MKIRIKGNSIRYRLSKSEVATLCTSGSISETTSFGTREFIYSIMSVADASDMTADFIDDQIVVSVPLDWITDWDTNAKIGFDAKQPLPDSNTLSILIEKDFTCLEERGEDETDLYPNPKLSQS